METAERKEVWKKRKEDFEDMIYRVVFDYISSEKPVKMQRVDKAIKSIENTSCKVLDNLEKINETIKLYFESKR